MAWFTWGDPATFHWGTIETDAGVPTQAGIAFNQVYAWLVGAAMSQPCSSASDGTWTCSLTRPGGYSALAIWNTQGSKSYTPSATYADFRDLAGNTVKITKGEPITIGAKPILLETPLTLQTSLTTTSERTGASMSSSATTSSSVMSSLQYPWQVGIGLLVTAVVVGGGPVSSFATTLSVSMSSLQYSWQVGIGLLVTAVVVVVLLGGIFVLRKRRRKP